MDPAGRNHYALVVADFRLELKQLEERVEKLRNAISFMEARMSSFEDSGADAMEKADAPYADLSLADAVVEYLKVAGHAVPTRVIADALKKGGYRTKSKNLYNNVYGTLSRETEKASPRVVKVGSRWDLPGREGSPDAGLEDVGSRLTQGARGQ